MRRVEPDTKKNRPLMNYPYATFYLEAQRAKRNLLHVFEAEPDVPAADPVLPAAKCAPAQARKKKADSRFNLSEHAASAEQRRIVSKACRDTTGPGHGVYNETTKRSALGPHSLALSDSAVS